MSSLSLSRRAAICGGIAATVSSGAAKAAGIARYKTLALQTRCDAVNQDANKADARARMRRALKRIEGEIASAQAFYRGYSGYAIKLVVLPEYYLTAFPLRETREEWRDKAAIAMDGAMVDAIRAMAQRRGVYLCSNHYERDPSFPDLYFQANVVFSDSGDIVLRYRRMISLYAPTPYDVWDRYLDTYGEDAIFPVARTPLGVLGTLASEEILYPEIARMHVLKGAEILLHPTSEEAAPGLTVKDISRRARAVENMAYVVSANSGGIYGTPFPANSTDAMSKVVDWHGKAVVEAGFGETMTAVATLDIDELREARQNTGLANVLSRLPMRSFDSAYARAQHYAPNRLKDRKMQGRAQALAAQRATIERLKERGVLTSTP
ncbi:MAG: nitrilase-related carbon-nitrogen hydrolase [Pseudomonadota bacterium]